MKKTISLLLLCAMICGMLAACGGKDTTGAEVTTAAGETTAAETAPLDPLEARKLISDDLGEYDFDGYEFRVVVDFGSAAGSEKGKAEMLVMDEATGDVIEDAIYERNRDVSERFNCKIVIAKEDGYSNCTSWMQNTVSAGEDAFDLASMHVVQLGGIGAAGYFTNWYDVDNVNFDKPWWSSSNKDVLTVNGVCFIAVGDYALTAMTQTYCIFYNKKLAADFEIGDVYGIVRDGDWTIDRIVEMTRDIYVDVNGDGKKDDGDNYGYVSNTYSNINAYLWSFNNPIFIRDGDDLKFVYKTEKIPAIVEKLCNTFNDHNGIYTNPNFTGPNNSSHHLGRELFRNSQAVFANGLISYSLLHFRELQDEYGIIPYPKWDDAQEEYYTMSDGNHMAMCMPVTIQDFERSGAIIEALCAESYKRVHPAYYDVALKVKAVRDEESIEMLDLVVGSCVYDFGYVYDFWKGCSFFLQTLVKDNNTNFESYWASKETAVMAHYDKVIQAFMEYGK